MSIALAPPAPQQELDELCSLLGSNGAAARFLGRKRAQISRWRNGDVELREDSVELIDGAWHAICLINRLVGEERVPAAVHQRWPLLRGRTPADLLHDEPDDLLDSLRAAVEGEVSAVGMTTVTSSDDKLDDEIAEWFAANLVPTPNAPAPIFAADVEDDDDDADLTPPPRLDDSWRGGRSASSDRWFKR